MWGLLVLLVLGIVGLAKQIEEINWTKQKKQEAIDNGRGWYIGMNGKPVSVVGGYQIAFRYIDGDYCWVSEYNRDKVLRNISKERRDAEADYYKAHPIEVCGKRLYLYESWDSHIYTKDKIYGYRYCDLDTGVIYALHRVWECYVFVNVKEEKAEFGEVVRPISRIYGKTDPDKRVEEAIRHINNCFERADMLNKPRERSVGVYDIYRTEEEMIKYRNTPLAQRYNNENTEKKNEWQI